MTTSPHAGRRSLTSLYGSLWSVVTATVHVLGLTATGVELPWQTTAAVFIVTSLLAGSCALSLEAVDSDTTSLLKSGWFGVKAGVVALTAVGLGFLLGWAGIGLLLVVHAASPRTPERVRSLRRRQAEAREPREDVVARPAPPAVPAATARPRPPVDGPPLEVPDHMSDEDLCLAWESSTSALRECRSVEVRVGIVQARQACLDELERRHPEAFRAWLAAGAGRGTSPARYLTS